MPDIEYWTETRDIDVVDAKGNPQKIIMAQVFMRAKMAAGTLVQPDPRSNSLKFQTVSGSLVEQLEDNTFKVISPWAKHVRCNSGVI